jgi:hypothetical protein
MTAPYFARLDGDRPEISRLMTAMLQAREALSRRSWSHPLEYTGKELVGRRARGPSCPPTNTRRPQPWRSEHLPATGRAARDHPSRLH